MIRPAYVLAAVFLFATPVLGEVLPQPGAVNPRLQTVRWQPGETVLLTMLPQSGLTLLLEPGERIHRVVLSDDSAWQVKISSEPDTLQVEPRKPARPGTMTVATDRREYRFGLRTDEGLTAAYLVRFEFGAGEPAVSPPFSNPGLAAPLPILPPGTWKLTGEPAVLPMSVTDDGAKTTISFAPDQALPAVFALGPTGQEEVVNGQMRGGAYVIDRVHDELVFRIDGERATARRVQQRP